MRVNVYWKGELVILDTNSGVLWSKLKVELEKLAGGKLDGFVLFYYNAERGEKGDDVLNHYNRMRVKGNSFKSLSELPSYSTLMSMNIRDGCELFFEPKQVEQKAPAIPAAPIAVSQPPQSPEPPPEIPLVNAREEISPTISDNEKTDSDNVEQDSVIINDVPEGESIPPPTPIERIENEPVQLGSATASPGVKDGVEEAEAAGKKKEEHKIKPAEETERTIQETKANVESVAVTDYITGGMTQSKVEEEEEKKEEDEAGDGSVIVCESEDDVQRELHEILQGPLEPVNEEPSEESVGIAQEEVCEEEKKEKENEEVEEHVAPAPQQEPSSSDLTTPKEGRQTEEDVEETKETMQVSTTVETTEVAVQIEPKPTREAEVEAETQTEESSSECEDRDNVQMSREEVTQTVVSDKPLQPKRTDELIQNILGMMDGQRTGENCSPLLFSRTPFVSAIKRLNDDFTKINNGIHELNARIDMCEVLHGKKALQSASRTENENEENATPTKGDTQWSSRHPEGSVLMLSPSDFQPQHARITDVGRMTIAPNRQTASNSTPFGTGNCNREVVVSYKTVVNKYMEERRCEHVSLDHIPASYNKSVRQVSPAKDPNTTIIDIQRLSSRTIVVKQGQGVNTFGANTLSSRLALSFDDSYKPKPNATINSYYQFLKNTSERVHAIRRLSTEKFRERSSRARERNLGSLEKSKESHMETLRKKTGGGLLSTSFISLDQQERYPSPAKISMKTTQSTERTTNIYDRFIPFGISSPVEEEPLGYIKLEGSSTYAIPIRMMEQCSTFVAACRRYNRLVNSEIDTAGESGVWDDDLNGMCITLSDVSPIVLNLVVVYMCNPLYLDPLSLRDADGERGSFYGGIRPNATPRHLFTRCISVIKAASALGLHSLVMHCIATQLKYKGKGSVNLRQIVEASGMMQMQDVEFVKSILLPQRHLSESQLSSQLMDQCVTQEQKGVDVLFWGKYINDFNSGNPVEYNSYTDRWMGKYAETFIRAHYNELPQMCQGNSEADRWILELCSNVEIVDLHGCEGVGGGIVFYILSLCRRAHVVDLSGTLVKEADVLKIPSVCTGVMVVLVRQCKNIPDIVLNRLVATLKGIRLVIR